MIAAINGTPVHRLTQTRELIPAASQKEFMRLVILMSTSRSHSAYRLAWDNSFSERIPFLPLHRRDLVSAEEGNKTFVGENRSRINWKKFEVMGEVVIGIQRSQKSPHPQAQRYEDIERLILDSRLSGDEEVCRERTDILISRFDHIYLTCFCTGSVRSQLAIGTIDRGRNRAQEVRLATHDLVPHPFPRRSGQV